MSNKLKDSITDKSKIFKDTGCEVETKETQPDVIKQMPQLDYGYFPWD